MVEEGALERWLVKAIRTEPILTACCSLLTRSVLTPTLHFDNACAIMTTGQGLRPLRTFQVRTCVNVAEPGVH